MSFVVVWYTISSFRSQLPVLESFCSISVTFFKTRWTWNVHGVYSSGTDFSCYALNLSCPSLVFPRDSILIGWVGLDVEHEGGIHDRCYRFQCKYIYRLLRVYFMSFGSSRVGYLILLLLWAFSSKCWRFVVVSWGRVAAFERYGD